MSELGHPSIEEQAATPLPRRRGRQPHTSIPIEVEVDQESEVSSPTVGASLGATINMGDFNSQRISIGLWGVPFNATQEQLEKLLPTATITIHSVVDGLAKEMKRRMEEDYGF